MCVFCFCIRSRQKEEEEEKGKVEKGVALFLEFLNTFFGAQYPLIFFQRSCFCSDYLKFQFKFQRSLFSQFGIWIFNAQKTQVFVEFCLNSVSSKIYIWILKSNLKFKNRLTLFMIIVEEFETLILLFKHFLDIWNFVTLEKHLDICKIFTNNIEIYFLFFLYFLYF